MRLKKKIIYNCGAQGKYAKGLIAFPHKQYFGNQLLPSSVPNVALVKKGNFFPRFTLKALLDFKNIKHEEKSFP